MKHVPSDFIWGAATASYQIEGSWDLDGKAPGIWDRYSQTPGNILGDHNGNVACDHLNRFREDVALMRDLGLDAYRFSVSWGRFLDPETGKINPPGAAFYDRLVDALLEAGVQPWVTCFHWDLPLFFEDRYGGWRGRDTALRFGDYCGELAAFFGDRVKNYFTMNEFWNFTDGGYLWACKAPGLKLPIPEVECVRHHALLGHGLGMRALRARGPADLRIGVAEACASPVPLVEDEAHLAAARLAFRDQMFLKPLMEGTYPEEKRLRLEQRGTPDVDADLKLISAPMDFVGLNSYAPKYVEPADTEKGYREIPFAGNHPHIGLDWLKVDPRILYWGPRLAGEVWGVENVYITENGCPGGDVEDTERIMYLACHLREAGRAVAEGHPLKGYFYWSLMDNFEWLEGYTQRFGLIHVWIGNRFSRGRGEEGFQVGEGCDHEGKMVDEGAKVKAKRQLSRSLP